MSATGLSFLASDGDGHKFDSAFDDLSRLQGKDDRLSLVLSTGKEYNFKLEGVDRIVKIYELASKIRR